MRVIAGYAKGKQLQMLSGNATRPTKAAVKEALFNILADRVMDARVLELYAGSGALGIEALSRGARTCMFVEKRRDACTIIHDNLISTGFKASVLCQDVRVLLRADAIHDKLFDIIIMDPPYDMLSDTMLRDVVESSLLARGGWLVLESHYRMSLAELSLPNIINRRYGKSRICIWENT